MTLTTRPMSTQQQEVISPTVRDRCRSAWTALRRRVLIDITITDPPSDAVVDRDVEVPMRDGVVLRANVFRPADQQCHPVILCAHPYGKDRLPRKRRFRRGYRPSAQYHAMQSEPITMSAWTSWEAPDPAYWVSRGYVVVNADLRGFGHSDGVGEVLSHQEGPDLYDLIEWSAQQSWSNGRVGMSGVSYLAMTQWAAAAARPPHLAAICPWEGFTDLYRDFARPGGIRENGFMFIWAAGFRAAGHPTDIRREVRRRRFADDWYAARDRPLENIEVPALICGSFSDHNLHTRGSFEGFRRISSDHKWLYTHRGQKWATYYSAAGLAAQAQFFDHFLDGKATGMLQTPAVRVEVREDADTVTSVRTASMWPPAETSWRTLTCGTGAGAGVLVDSPPVAAEIASSFDIRRGRATFTHTFAQDTEVVGPMQLEVTLSVQKADDIALFAGVRKIRDGTPVGFNGSYGFAGDLVTHGMLLASHRAIDPALSLPYQPCHLHREAVPLQPGHRVDLALGLLPSATLFRAGEQLRLELQGHWFFSRNPLIGQFPPAYHAAPRTGSCTIHRGTLTVPIAVATG